MPWAVVEIAGECDERERTELIRAAYRSSRSGLVALVLRGVTRQIADRALDPVVDTRRDHGRAVIYMDADQPNDDLMSAAAHASVVIASTEEFRIELLKHGIRASGVADVTSALLDASEPH